MVKFCPHCGTGLVEPIGPSCGSCHGDITFMAAALLKGSVGLNAEMKKKALLQKHGLEDKEAEKLEPGDLIEIFRGNYQHWAVYVGDGDVVHLVGLGAGSSGSSSAISSSTVAGGVRKDKLKDVVNGSKWKINNEKHPNYDNTLKARPKADIVNEALSRVRKDVNYKLTTSNCEHFATECRYGKALSIQVKNSLVGSLVSLSSTPEPNPPVEMVPVGSTPAANSSDSPLLNESI